MFDLSITKILILGLLGLVIFGPDQLPRLAAQAGRALRDLRRLADNAKADLTRGGRADQHCASHRRQTAQPGRTPARPHACLIRHHQRGWGPR